MNKEEFDLLISTLNEIRNAIMHHSDVLEKIQKAIEYRD